jgi:hypothetical protein
MKSLPPDLEECRARLVGDVVTLQRTPRGVGVLAGCELEGVEAAAREQEQFVLAHAGADGSELAAEIEPLAQQARLRVASTFARVRKLDLDQAEIRQLVGEFLHGIRRRKAHAARAAVTAQALSIAPHLGQRQDQRGRGRRVGGRGSLSRELTPPQDAAQNRPPGRARFLHDARHR